MSEDKWQVLENLARSRGYELDVNGDRFTLAPRVGLSSQPRSSVLIQGLDDAGVETASDWLQDKKRIFDPWPFL